MIIRKEFRVESAHIVRNCTSERCSHSVHGHSSVIEVFFEGRQLDNAQMLMDFGLMKGSIKQFIDSMDHCYLLCDKDSQEFREFIKSNCDRYIEMPFNPSAEMLSTFILAGVNFIIQHTEFNNGEGEFHAKAVRYHETTTGYAEADLEDVDNFLGDMTWDQITFSDGVMKDWSEELKDSIQYGRTMVNPMIEQQITL